MKKRILTLIIYISSPALQHAASSSVADRQPISQTAKDIALQLKDKTLSPNDFTTNPAYDGLREDVAKAYFLTDPERYGQNLYASEEEWKDKEPQMFDWVFGRPSFPFFLRPYLKHLSIRDYQDVGEMKGPQEEKWALLSNRHLNNIEGFTHIYGHCRAVFLASNCLDTEALGELAFCRQIEELDIRDNPFRAVPSVIACLSHLVDLSLRNTQLTTLPESFSQLTTLKKLDLANNQLTPDAVERIPAQNITYLSLSGNPLREISAALQFFVNCRVLALRDCKLDGTGLEHLAQLSKLFSLTLENNQITKLPAALASLVRLERVNLQKNCLTEAELITAWPELYLIDLSQNQLTRIPAGLQELQKLHSIYLSRNIIDKPNFAYIPPHLGVLDLRSCQIKNIDFTPLSEQDAHLSIKLEDNLLNTVDPRQLENSFIPKGGYGQWIRLISKHSPVYSFPCGAPYVQEIKVGEIFLAGNPLTEETIKIIESFGE